MAATELTIRMAAKMSDADGRGKSFVEGACRTEPTLDFLDAFSSACSRESSSLHIHWLWRKTSRLNPNKTA